ncbi:MAG TPA: glucuronate isomerase [Candidatus Angelobacter sp.]|nr:glucuronate isomerase [Candidatus Angelobacter sp.]
MGFITEDFLLQSDTARYLYTNYASDRLVLDYHCHLLVQDIARNRRFHNLFEIWLEGDHYKWRAMRANGVLEHYCTGGAEPYEKFLAWARTVPNTLRNPLYHWTHLELLRYFQIEQLLNESTAPAIWKLANERLMEEELTAQGILAHFGVAALCTSDDPTDSLDHHAEIQSSELTTSVFPTFRPDRAIRIGNPVSFNKWVAGLGQRAQVEVKCFSDFLDALRKRHDDFHRHGCRLSDHGLDHCYAESCTEAQAAAIFDQVRRGDEPAVAEATKFASYMMLFFGRLDAEKGWTKQLHLGAYRDANPGMLTTLGPDTGFDSIGDWPQVQALGAYLGQLDRAGVLPKMIIYNANPADNYAIATMIGNFQDGTVAGKLQFGAGWWFLDQKEGIEQQLDALSNCGLLARFIGMVTDSRSFMSYPRHEYFRRILCNILGSEMESGMLPNDEALIGAMISRICYHNAAEYLELPLAHAAPKPVASSFAAHSNRQHSRAVETGLSGRVHSD